MKIWLLIFFSVSTSAIYAQDQSEVIDSETAPVQSNNNFTEHRDYNKNDFKVSVKLLRAGVHDETNKNSYYFIAHLNGLVNTPEERKMEFKDRKKIAVEIEKFGEITLESLIFWRPDPKESEEIQLQITGDMIREIIANTMQTHSVKENEVSVRLDFEMWEKGKKFFFFGEDKKITESSFYPIPPSKFDTPERTNLNLEMTDEQGTLVQLAVEYDQPINSAKSK